MSKLVPSPSQLDGPQLGLLIPLHMFRDRADIFLFLHDFLMQANRILERSKDRNEWDSLRNAQVSDTDKSGIIEVKDDLVDLFDRLHLNSTSKGFKRFVARIESGEIATYEDYLHRWQDLYDRFSDELDDQFVFVAPPDRASYWGRDDHVSDAVRNSFPASALEVRMAGSAYCCSLWTACVFHCMRAAESGLRVVAEELTGEAPSDIAGMKEVINSIRGAANRIDDEKRSDDKSARGRHYSEIAANAMLFKDAWRNHVAHAHVVYDQQQALQVMTATCHFFEGVVAPISSQKD